MIFLRNEKGKGLRKYLFEKPQTKNSKKLNPWHLSYEFENVTAEVLDWHKAFHLSAAEACIP